MKLYIKYKQAIILSTKRFLNMFIQNDHTFIDPEIRHKKANIQLI